MPRRPRTTETIEIPAAFADLIQRRCADLVRQSTYDRNIIKSITLSCYFQGLLDGAQLCAERPALLEELRVLHPRGDAPPA